MKISTKLTLQILSIAVIPLLVLGGLALYQMVGLAERDFFDKVSQDADFHEQQIEGFILDQKNKVESLATSSQMSAILSRVVSSIDEELLPSPSGNSEINQATKEYLDHYFWREAPGVVQDDSFSDLYLISVDGDVLYGYGNVEIMGHSLQEPGKEANRLRVIWQQVVKQGKIVVDGYQRSSHTGWLSMFVASPIYSWNELIGVVLVQYGSEWVEEQLVQSTLMGDTEDLVVLVADERGSEFIRSSRFTGEERPCASEGGDILGQVLVPTGQSSSKGVGWRVNARCQDVVADWRHIPLINAEMVVTVGRSEVMADYNWFKTLFLSMTAGVILLILLISYSASHMITRRIVLLKGHALEIAKGDLQQRIGDYGRDEVGLLADALRSMMKTIRDRTMRLERANQRMWEEEEQREKLIQIRTQELYEAKSYVEKIISTMRDVLVVSDEKGCIKLLNRTASELLRYSEDELLGQPVTSIFEGGAVEQVDHEEIFGLDRMECLKGHLEEAIQNDFENFLRMVENSPIALLGIDEDGVIDLANVEAERIFGYNRQELYGLSVEELVPQSMRSQHHQWRTGFSSGQSGRQQAMSPRSGVAGVKKDGSEIALRIGITRIKMPHGDRMLAVIHDDTSYARWGISSFTPFGRLFFEGVQHSEVMLRRSDGEQVPVLLSGEVLRGSDDQYQGFVLVMWDLRERKALEAKSNEAAYQGGLGEMSATILHNIGNVVTGLGGSAFNVRHQLEDLKLVAKGLDRLGEQLQTGEILIEDEEKIVAAVGQAAGIIHDVTYDKVADDLDSIEKSIQHISDIITLQQGLVRGGVWATDFDLAEAVREAVSMQMPSLDKAQIKCVLKVETAAVQARLPRGPLQQMLVNFLKNSREAIEGQRRGDGEIEVLLRLLDRGGERKDQVQIVVSDNGGGVNEAILKQIFDSGFTTKPTGNGLGLHSAATFVQSVRGEIDVENSEHGALFTVTLPLWYEGE